MRVVIEYYLKHLDIDKSLYILQYVFILYLLCILHEISIHTLPLPPLPFVTISNFQHNGFLLTIISPGGMAPTCISPLKLFLIRGMIEIESFVISEIAKQAKCRQQQTITCIRNNLGQFGSIYAPETRIGRKEL